MRGAERVSGILLKPESLPGANEVGGHDRGKHYVLVVDVLQQHSVVPGTNTAAAVVSCVVHE